MPKPHVAQKYPAVLARYLEWWAQLLALFDNLWGDVHLRLGVEGVIVNRGKQM